MKDKNVRKFLSILIDRETKIKVKTGHIIYTHTYARVTKII